MDRGDPLTGNELEELRLAHSLFSGDTRPQPINVTDPTVEAQLQRPAAVGAGDASRHYQLAVSGARTAWVAGVRTDDAATTILTAAHRDHAEAHEATRRVLDEALADTAGSDHPAAQREAARRRVARLRAQRAHVTTARAQARHHAAALSALRYRGARRRRTRPSGLSLRSNSRAEVAVRAALSRLGRPYVWGAAGPDQFDCSGLVKWSYAQAGVHLDRTTYQQIHDGIPVSRAQVRPGDLVFPHSGHVQIALGHDLVVEAPYSGATVRISRLGPHVQIRRPVF
jgi:cell wall-associated NlpC family hydrolase